MEDKSREITPEENVEKKVEIKRLEPSIKVFPGQAMRRIFELEMKESRNVERISGEALIVLHDALLKEGRRIAKRALEYCEREKRKTISSDDVKKAIADCLF